MECGEHASAYPALCVKLNKHCKIQINTYFYSIHVTIFLSLEHTVLNLKFAIPALVDKQTDSHKQFPS